jgi:hypothetical protein
MHDDDPTLAAAFRDMHGPRLHGFAKLITLGDERAAERAAGRALEAGAERAAALRHPERAAAWLRARTLHELNRWLRGGRSIPASTRRQALAALGVDDGVYEALAPMPVRARAALVASAIERFEPIDIETILDAGPAATRRAVANARDRYLRSVRSEPGQTAEERAPNPDGELARRVMAVVSRAMSATGRRK